MISRLSRSGYVTFLLPPYFKQSFHEFLLLEIMWCDVWAIGWHVLFCVRVYRLSWRYIWFVNSWRSLLNWGAAACVVLILKLRLVLFASFWHCWSFQRFVNSDNWHRTLRAIYIPVVPFMYGGVKFFRDSTEMELSLCDVILEKDWMSWHQVVLIFLRARVLILGYDESFYYLHGTC